ncbi:MAG: SpoIIE family protein phosphatase [Halobacteriovoraceae bacterium]|nr:SpoIIE family protein phosphatase [Halobacteriovoraceae bacterium]
MPLIKELPLIIKNNREAQFGKFDFENFTVGYYCSMGKDKTQNEDVLFIAQKADLLVFGVSDGAGGHPRGQDAAIATAETLLNEIKKSRAKNLNFFSCIEKANKAVLGLKAGAFCTLSMVEINKDFLRTFHVGDSEIISWNSIGDKCFATIPHSMIGHSIEAGVMSQEESLGFPERHIVNNMLGDPAVRIEGTTERMIKKGHTILLGTDGIFDNISHVELGKLCNESDFGILFDSLKNSCTEKKNWKKEDDIAFIVIRKN